MRLLLLGAAMVVLVPAARIEAAVQEERKCAQCAAVTKGTEKFCKECGGTLEPVGPRGDGERKCPKCNAAAQPGQKFCGECGAAIEKKKEEPAVLLCPKCNIVGKTGQRFCLECGTRLEMSTAKDKPKPKGITVKTALTLPSQVQGTAVQLSGVCFQAVYFASVQSSGGQRVVTTGTARQSAAKQSEWIYTSTPNDRLRVEFANGTAMEFGVTALRGDFSDGGKNFANADHQFEFRVVVAGTADLQVSSVRQNNAHQVRVKGKLKLEEVEYESDLRYDVGKGAENPGGKETGNGGYQMLYGGLYQGNVRIQGSIRSGSFDMTVNEANSWESISGDHDSASASSRTIDNAWTLNGVKYQFAGRIRRSFKNDRPARVNNEWAAEGGVFRDGKQYGALRLAGTKRGEEQDKLVILLELPDEKIELEVHDRQ